MIRPGTYDARIHSDGWVRLDPRILNGHKELFAPWPAGEMYVAVDRVPEGAFLAFVSSEKDAAALASARLKQLEQRLVNEGVPRSDIRHLREDIAKAGLTFEKRPFFENGKIELGWLCDEITLHDYHVWHSPLIPFVPGVEHYVELWPSRVFNRYHQRIAFEVNAHNPGLMKRALW
ncbi:hypothetical protein HY493_04220 [Candidatus Woesearchaeota archaeon]|nr:hypothetical protein [Candidatus Woesearchaeota archaeon]